MSSQPDVTRIVRSWLEEGVDRLPDRVLDSVMDLVPSTPQRRSRWPARRFQAMPKLYRVALVAAAALVVVVAGINLLPHASVGPAGPSPSPTPSSAPIALRDVDIERLLPAGAYRIDTKFAKPFNVTVPTGWALKSLAQGDVGLARTAPGIGAAWLSIDLIHGIVMDPCHSEAGVASPWPTTVDETVQALRRMVGFTSGPVTPVTIGGFSGQELVLTNAIDTSTANCTGGPMLPIWTFLGNDVVAGGTNGGLTEHLFILDVHGTLVAIDAEFGAGTPVTWQQEMLQIVPTIRFD